MGRWHVRTAFARLESFEDSDDTERVAHDFSVSSVEPFVLTWKTTEAEAGPAR